MDQISFSIVIPVYNVGRALEKCVESIRNQPYDDYEVILVNDGSTDSVTKTLLSKYENETGNIRVYHKENGGCVDARRYGINKSHGKYITFGDGDDFFSRNYVEILHKAVENKADIYVLNNYINEPNSDRFHKEKSFISTGYMSVGWYIQQLLEVKMNAVWDKIYKRELFGKDADIIPEKITFGEDIYINNMYLPAVRSVYVLDEAIFYHFVDSNTSVCASQATFKRLSDSDVVFNSLNGIKSLAGVTKKYCEEFKDFFYGYYARSISGLIKSGVDKKVIKENIGNNIVMRDISVVSARTLKGFVYRLLLKMNAYTLIAFVCK